MTQRTHRIVPREIGMIRIYIKPSDKRKQAGLRGMFASRPLYRELIDTAKKDGIMNAVAHHTHYGFSNHGRIRKHDPESGNANLTMCVELISSKEQLDIFCRNHGDLLKDKVIIYKHIEHWDIHGDDMEKHDATAKELKLDDGV